MASQETDDIPNINRVRMDRPGIRKALGDLEAEIMELMWERAPGSGMTVREVFEVLEQRRRIAYTTVMNTMARLARKKLLRAETGDQAYVYYPICSKSEFVSHFVEQIVTDLLVNFAGETTQSLARLADPQAAERARELLAEITRRRASRTRRRSE